MFYIRCGQSGARVAFADERMRRQSQFIEHFPADYSMTDIRLSPRAEYSRRVTFLDAYVMKQSCFGQEVRIRFNSFSLCAIESLDRHKGGMRQEQVAERSGRIEHIYHFHPSLRGLLRKLFQ